MIPERIRNILKNNQIDFEEHHHEPVRTSEEAARVRNSSIHEGAKALIFWATKIDGHKVPIELVIQGSKKVHKEKFLGKHKEFTKIKMVSPEEVLDIAGVEPGGVPPFGNVFNKPCTIYVDCGLLELKNIEFNAGDRSISIRMKTEDWAKVTNPIISDFAE